MQTPTASYGDALSIGQLANRWGKSTEFVRTLTTSGDLAVNERGLVTNSELHRFYTSGGQSLLDA